MREEKKAITSNHKKVLLVSVGNLCRGGVQTFLLNWIKHANKNDYTFVWYFTGEIEDKEYAEEFIKEKVILRKERISLSKGKINRHWHYFVSIMKILKNDNFDIIHVNTGSLSIQAEALLAARINKIKIRIAHSHNYLNENRIQIIFSKLLRMIIVYNATCFAACSEVAAKWLIGTKNFSKVKIINNCIDSKKYAYSEITRKNYRNEMGLTGKFIIGHVGNFNAQKNHHFLLEVFGQIAKEDDSAQLLLVGSGKLQEKIKAKVDDYGLTDKVFFTGSTDHVQEYMCAMDIFVLPSVYEGFGIVNIEAQANGLPCLLSTAVAKEAKVTDLVQFLPLNAGVDTWAKTILSMKRTCDIHKREQSYKEILNSIYDIGKFEDYISMLYR